MKRRPEPRVVAWLVGVDEGRVSTVDARVADAWGTIVARREKAGRPIGAIDALIAAIAEAHALTLVTGNIADFEFAVALLFDPWIG